MYLPLTFIFPSPLALLYHLWSWNDTIKFKSQSVLWGVTVGRYGEWWRVVTRRIHKQEDNKQAASADTGPLGVVIWCPSELVWGAESFLSIPLPVRNSATLLQLHSIRCLEVKVSVSLQFVYASFICGHCRNKLKYVLATASLILMFICYRYRQIVAKSVICMYCRQYFLLYH